MWFAWSASGDGPRHAIVMAMAGVWGLRLGGHLLRRVSREAEDGRYQQLRREWGARGQRRLFLFFQIQALWAVLFAAPMLAAAENTRAPLAWFDAAGVVIWIVAVAGEAVADRQLARFRADPANAAPSAATASGATRATRTTSSNGSTGGPTCCWRSGLHVGGCRRPARW